MAPGGPACGRRAGIPARSTRRAVQPRTRRSPVGRPERSRTPPGSVWTAPARVLRIVARCAARLPRASPEAAGSLRPGHGSRVGGTAPWKGAGPARGEPGPAAAEVVLLRPGGPRSDLRRAGADKTPRAGRPHATGPDPLAGTLQSSVRQAVRVVHAAPGPGGPGLRRGRLLPQPRWLRSRRRSRP